MKRKLVSLFVAFIVTFSSTMPCYAMQQLERPIIDDIWHDKSSISFTWDGIDYAKKYKIFRSTSKDGPFTHYDTCEDEFYSDYDVNKGVRYYYKVKAVATHYKASTLSKWRSNKIPKPKAHVSTTVYVTETGSKYHRYGCQYLWNSCYSISKSSAQAQGYTACSRCW